MTRPCAVGNDIVDLSDPRTAHKDGDPRFLAKVLGDPERAALSMAADPAAELWAFWSAKEAAYKVVSKLRGAPPVFEHAAFRVAWARVEPGRWRGIVSHEGVDIPVLVRRAGGTVHAVAVHGADLAAPLVGMAPLDVPPGAWGARLAELRSRFTEREADAVHSFPSAAVRVEARAALAIALSAAEGDVEIRCDPGVTGRRPPRAFVRGEPAAADVSLSHHGNWIAWAILAQNPLGR